MPDTEKTREQLIAELTALRQRLTATDAAREQAELAMQASQAWMLEAQTSATLGTLASGCAHDLNNFLSIIAGYTEISLEYLDQPARVQAHLESVLQATEHAKDLTQQLLSLSREPVQRLQPLPLHQTVAEALNLVRIMLPSHIQLQTHISQEAGIVLADATQIHQVVINLANNAMHAMQDTGGILEVRLETVDVDEHLMAQHPTLTSGSYVRVMVRDTGHGISPAVMEHIFEPFFTNKPSDEGTGLGLTLAHHIITRHEGTITVASAPQQGTTVTFYLPRSDPESSVPEDSECGARSWIFPNVCSPWWCVCSPCDESTAPCDMIPATDILSGPMTTCHQC